MILYLSDEDFDKGYKAFDPSYNLNAWLSPDIDISV